MSTEPIMEAELVALFKANNVHAAVAEEFRKFQCTRPQTRAMWFDDISTGAGPFLQSVTEVKDDMSQKPSVKFCAITAAELTRAQVTRSAQGMHDTPLDEPLPAEQQRSIINIAVALYRGMNLDSRCYVCESQLAKFRKEFIAWQPSMVALAKFRPWLCHKGTRQPSSLTDGRHIIQSGAAIEDGWNSIASSHGQRTPR